MVAQTAGNSKGSEKWLAWGYILKQSQQDWLNGQNMGCECREKLRVNVDLVSKQRS